MIRRCLAFVKKFWLGLGAILLWVNTRVLLTLVFFLVVTPLGWIARVLGQGGIDDEFPSSGSSDWVERGDVAFDAKRLERQF